MARAGLRSQGNKTDQTDQWIKALNQFLQSFSSLYHPPLTQCSPGKTERSLVSEHTEFLSVPQTSHTPNFLPSMLLHILFPLLGNALLLPDPPTYTSAIMERGNSLLNIQVSNKSSFPPKWSWVLAHVLS